MGSDLSDATGVLTGGTQTRVARDDQLGTIEVMWEGEKFPSGDDVIRVLNRMMWNDMTERVKTQVNTALGETQEDEIDRLRKRLKEARALLQDIIDARTKASISLPTKVSEAINKAYAFLALDRTST